ncbi:hypothetical protein A2982_00380 [candidate division WWE3 bacterium RIFCSPLOWO2_01_FULL_39_13]|uniref:PPM-type phosphatase domain-containing protein n=1 Tax=candidate division WWE3 bacterium RIFCSPLOWO2_01_FULL_39_13 TaxID=1802624 RepID=A0A1F4V507_UNCKA|nr:MAG: hypothetical protein A2982_00380 [candidate division WWE3 bacterium RIFCSPLOWO2_01_FULL_39_13]
MEFSLKIQHLGGNEALSENRIFLTHEFETPEENVLVKRGRLFIAIGLESAAGFDLSSAASLFFETTQESYYRVTDDTPLNAIEKSLNRAYQTLLSFRSENEESGLGSAESNLKFSFCTALIWNKVLYVSYLGHPAAFLIRGAGARNLGTEHPASEIWTNSSILDDDDVIVIGTEEFAKTYPPAEIISSLGSISETLRNQPEHEKLKAILIKTSIKSSVSSESFLDRIRNTRIKNSITNSLRSVQDRIVKSQKLSDKFKFYQSKKAAPISSISRSSQKSAVKPGLSAESVSKRISKVNRRKREARQIMVGLVMIAAAGYAGYRLIYSSPEQNNPESNLTLNSEEKEDKMYSEIMGIQSRNLNYPLIANISDATEKFQPAGLAASKGNVVILLNSANSSLIQVDIETQKIEEIGIGFERAVIIRCGEGLDLCGLYGGHDLYVVDPDTPDNIDRYTINLDGVVDIYPYGRAVYLLTSGGIYKSALDSTSSPEKWSDDGENFFNASSFAVDGSVYVSAGGKIYKYYNKKLVADFSIDSSRLHDPGKIAVQGNTLYVMNLQTHSIALFAKQTGEFLMEIKIEGYTTEAGPSLFTVTRGAKHKIIFLEGSYLYSIDLE